MKTDWQDQGRVGILAGNGAYPLILADCLRAEHVSVVVAGIRGHFRPRPGLGDAYGEVCLGDLRDTIRFFKSHGARHIFLAGGIRRRHALSTARPDLLGACLLPLAVLKGDDSLLRGTARIMGLLGIEVVDPSPAIGRLLARRGHLAGPLPGPGVVDDITVAHRGAKEIGMRDRGQAAVAFRGNLAGLEGRAGTNALIANAPGPGAVLVKVVKPDQDLRFDRPAIGPSTILLAAARGMRAVAVEAGGVLLLERDRVEEICCRRNVSLLGI